MKTQKKREALALLLASQLEAPGIAMQVKASNARAHADMYNPLTMSMVVIGVRVHQ